MVAGGSIGRARSWRGKPEARGGIQRFLWKGDMTHRRGKVSFMVGGED